MAHVSQAQRKAHTAIYNLITRVNNKEGGSDKVDKLLKFAVWELAQVIHPSDVASASRLYNSVVTQCFDEDGK